MLLLRAQASGQVPGPQLGEPALRPVPQAPVPQQRQEPSARVGPLASAKPADESGAAPGAAELRGDAASREGKLSYALEQYLDALKPPPFPLARSIYTGPPPRPQPPFWNADDQRRHRVMEKAIAVTQRMPSPPEIPEAARRAMRSGDTIVHSATSLQDFDRALDDFVSAAEVAPWWPRALWGASVLAEQLGNYTTALNYLKLYQLAAPDRNDQEVRARRAGTKADVVMSRPLIVVGVLVVGAGTSAPASVDAQTRDISVHCECPQHPERSGDYPPGTICATICVDPPRTSPGPAPPPPTPAPPPTTPRFDDRRADLLRRLDRDGSVPAPPIPHG